MTLERFAKDYRLKVRLGGCGDAIIPGRRGQLYFDRGELCLMMLDASPVKTSRLDSLIGPGGSVWQGDKSPNKAGRRVQDVEVRGIAPAKYREAIRIAGVKPRQIRSEAQKAVLERARAANPLCKAREGELSLALETIPEAGVILPGAAARRRLLHGAKNAQLGLCSGIQPASHHRASRPRDPGWGPEAPRAPSLPGGPPPQEARVNFTRESYQGYCPQCSRNVGHAAAG